MKYPERFKVSTTTTGTGTLTLGSAATGYQGTSALTDGETYEYTLLDANGTAWEVGLGTYASSGTTLARTTIYGSSNSGSAINLSAGTHTVIVGPTGTRAQRNHDAVIGDIKGLEISYSSTTAIAVAAGTVNINGKRSTYAGGTLTSGSTMKDNNNSTVTLGASKCYYVYAFDNAGTLEIRVQDYAAATYGGAPTFDTTYDYWKGPSVGAQARRIGRFFTNGSSNIIKFYQVRRGRWSKTYMYDRQVIIYVNGVAQASYTSITITPYITADVAAYDLSTQWITAAAAATGGISLSWDSGTTADGNRVYFSGATNHNAISASWETPNTGTLHYKTDNSSTAYISLAAVSEVV